MAAVVPADPEQADAQAAGLTYVCDLDPGIRRRRARTTFSYALADGTIVSSSAVLKRIRCLAVPPAWTDVWICASATGHIQATGRDARGRKQYIYHPDWRDIRDRNKYDRLINFARQLPRIRRCIDAEMAKRGMPRGKVLATVVSLLDKTLIRIGNGEYARANGSFGLTTLRTRHIDVQGSELRFHFKGKSGKTWRLNIRDKRIARIVRSIQELPGQRLFQYLDDDGEARTVDSTDVNAYLQEIAGPDVSAKDFRTWAGTVLTVRALGAIGPFTSQSQAKANIRRAIGAVAVQLGNTTTICRKCYVHPDVVTCYLEHRLPALGDSAAVGGRGLPKDEAAVLRLLERAAAARNTRRRTASASPRSPALSL